MIAEATYRFRIGIKCLKTRVICQKRSSKDKKLFRPIPDSHKKYYLFKTLFTKKENKNTTKTKEAFHLITKSDDNIREIENKKVAVPKNWKPIKTQFKEPSRIIRKPEDDFFYDPEESISFRLFQSSGRFLRAVAKANFYNSYDLLPLCIANNSPNLNLCEECCLSISNKCKLLDDGVLFRDLLRIVKIRKSKQAEQRHLIQDYVKLIQNELCQHGRALHYSFIFRLVRNKYPKIDLSELQVYRLLLKYPELFIKVAPGVFYSSDFHSHH